MSTQHTTRNIYWLLWAALTAAYLAGPIAHLSDYVWDYDEGPQMQAAALAHRGYPLYSEVVLNKPPLLTWFLQLAFCLGGTTLPTARMAVLGVTVVGFVVLGLLAEQWWGRWAGPAAMVLFLTLPEVPVRAAVVMNDLPAMSAALAALTTATLFRRTGRRSWLVACAVAYVAVLGLHPLFFFILIPTALLLLTAEDARARWHNLLFFGLIVAGGIALGLFLVDWRELIHWVYEYNVAGRELLPLRGAWTQIVRYLSAHWPLVGPAVVGGGVLLITPSRRFWAGVVVVWFLTTVTAFLSWQSVWFHYLLFLLYPLVVTAGGGIATVGRWLIGQKGSTVWWRRGLAVLMLVIMLPLIVKRITTPLEWRPWPAEQWEARAFLEQQGTERDFIVSDDQFLAFAAGYLVPPSLADTSHKRITAGYLQTEDVIGALLRYKAHFLVFGTGRFSRLYPLARWTREAAFERHDFGPIRVYRLDFPVGPTHPLDSYLGGAIRLRGYTIAGEDALRAGGAMTVTLFWESVAPVEEDFTVFVHLLDAAGRLAGQHDSPPLQGWYPTSRWTPGVLVPDPHPVTLSTGLVPGRYRLLVGMYRRPSIERLPATRPDGSRWPDDCIMLTEIAVTPFGRK